MICVIAHSRIHKRNDFHMPRSSAYIATKSGGLAIML
jgi:hypothetical protein